ncbi:MAG: EF-hand domain-containing protein [Gammaproteobacteria bacterium]|jgi:hypothetical protein
MDNQSVRTLLIVGFTVFSAAAWAGKYGDSKGRFMGFFDTNGDGVVTMDEFNAAAANRFDNMDADNNGVVTLEEFKTYIGQKRSERRQQKFQTMDINKDGQVSQDEYISYKQKRAESRFQNMDINNDGVVSKEEYDARKSRWSGHHKYKYGHHGRKGGIFGKLDANGDGQVTREESLAAWTGWFRRIDANNDQVVTEEEVRVYRASRMGAGK